MRTVILTFFALLAAAGVQAKTLVVYYSYTNNVERVVDALRCARKLMPILWK